MHYSPPLPCLLKRRCAALRTPLSKIESPRARQNLLPTHSALHHHIHATAPSNANTQKPPSQSVSPAQCINNALRHHQRDFVSLPSPHNHRGSLYFDYTPPEPFTQQIQNTWLISMALFISKICCMLQAQLNRVVKPHKLASLHPFPLCGCQAPHEPSAHCLPIQWRCSASLHTTRCYGT